MNRISYRRLICVEGLCSLLALVLLGVGCAKTDAPSQTMDNSMNAWTHVDYLEPYSFRGNVFEDKDLSGIACISTTHGLIGADESGLVQTIELSRKERTLTVLGAVSLLGSGEEIDIEGIAAEDDFYYVVGSHGVAKKSGLPQVRRYTICRLTVDRATGMPKDGRTTPAVASLSSILEADPTLGPYFGKPLQQKGVNIEGLAVRKGQLFVGLRNPNLDGCAFVLEVGADDIFAKVQRPAYTLHQLALGAGLGIREIVAAKTGFLLIAGNAGSEPSDAYPEAQDYEKDRGYELFQWNGQGSAVHKIGPIPNPPGKAEAMTILEETADAATVLVLFDGPRQGNASVYRLH